MKMQRCFALMMLSLFGGLVLSQIALCEEPKSVDKAADKPAADKPTSEEKWTPLFNGKNLEGWTPKIRHSPLGENYGDTFRVEEGVLKVGYDKEKYPKFDERFGHLFYKDTFSHYKLRLEYRFVGEQCAGGPGWAIRNSGIMIHGEDPAGMSKEQDFPASIEVQLLGGNGKATRTTANLCTPYTNVEMKGKLFLPHCTSSSSKTFHGDQWVTCEVEVRGSEVVKHFINGELVLEYNKPQLDDREAIGKKLIEKNKGIKLLERGTISLQSESHPVEFRKVEIQVLKE